MNKGNRTATNRASTEQGVSTNTPCPRAILGQGKRRGKVKQACPFAGIVQIKL